MGAPARTAILPLLRFMRLHRNEEGCRPILRAAAFSCTGQRLSGASWHAAVGGLAADGGFEKRWRTTLGLQIVYPAANLIRRYSQCLTQPLRLQYKQHSPWMHADEILCRHASRKPAALTCFVRTMARGEGQ